MATKACSSCRKQITNLSGTVEFLCPKCSKTAIVRCRDCRKTATKYKCEECGFTGPN